MRAGGFLVTRGMTGSHTNMLVRGMIPFIEEALEELGAKIIGRTKKEKAYDESDNVEYDEYTIVAKLEEVNGKDLVRPIINKINKQFSDINITITASADKLTVKSPDIKVDVVLVRSKNVTKN
jgi:short-subunit dehydrogenase involved in D-alanine esterification of teichoic acids